MTAILSIEELVINDSFNNYCFQNNEPDILYWEQYLRTYPSEKEKIIEAKQFVLNLTFMLQQEYGENKTAREPNAGDDNLPLIKQGVLKKMLRFAAAVAAIFTLFFIAKKSIYPYMADQKKIQATAGNQVRQGISLFRTLKGEKKLIILSDSTKLYLNAGSELRVDEDFGKKNRRVYLIGEALFDVTHDKTLPFIVHIDKCDIKVLGTFFNVKSYPGDQQSETSLIRGKVEIQIAGSYRKILLFPNEKVIISNKDDNTQDKGKRKSVPPAEPEVSMLPLTYNEKDNAVIETAWSQNRLEIVDESFAAIKGKLERWYNVKITFKDEEVSKYRFSAAFEKETIQQVLQALQNADHFTYEIKDREITISK